MAAVADAEAVLEHIGPGADLIVPLANGEPVAAARRHRGQRRPLAGRRPSTRCTRSTTGRTCTARSATGCATSRTSCRTSPGRASGPGRSTSCRTTSARCATSCAPAPRDPLVLAAASPLDRHGYFSLGVNADYVASFIGRARFFLEANAQMPRTFGRNQIHVSQVARLGRRRPPAGRGRRRRERTDIDERIAALVAERIPDRATIQTGIGAIPNAILSALARPSRPRRAHRADLRRRDGARRGRRRHRRGQAAQPHQDRRHVRPRHRAAVPLPRRQRGVRAVAGALRQRPAGDRPGGTASCRSTPRCPST